MMTLPINRKDELVRLLKYKAWANTLTFESVGKLPDGEAFKFRQTRFGSIVHTLNHVWVVEDIFKHHLEGKRHAYSARNTDSPPPIAELVRRVETMDAWWIDFIGSLEDANLDIAISFDFVGGGKGEMTPAEIVLHIVNHATYHRGFVGDMLYQAGISPSATDIPVYIRDVDHISARIRR